MVHTEQSYVCQQCGKFWSYCNTCVDNNGKKKPHGDDPCRQNATKFYSNCKEHENINN